MRETHKSVCKLKTQQGRKVGGTYCVYNPTGTTIAVGCQDGTIQLWSTNQTNRPSLIIKEAHNEFGGDVTCLNFSKDGHTLISRALDDTLKIWDIRNIKQPLTVFNELPNFGQTSCIFSPDERLIITGTL